MRLIYGTSIKLHKKSCTLSRTLFSMTLRMIRWFDMLLSGEFLVIGEAANHVSESFKARHPHIPWKSIIAQRNILAHEYGEILVERIWRVATEKIPELIKAIEPLVPTPPQE